MKPRKFEIIECPHCGREYLPAEIFVPHPFFGRPRDIVRDVYGHILDFEGNSRMLLIHIHVTIVIQNFKFVQRLHLLLSRQN